MNVFIEKMKIIDMRNMLNWPLKVAAFYPPFEFERVSVEKRGNLFTTNVVNKYRQFVHLN